MKLIFFLLHDEETLFVTLPLFEVQFLIFIKKLN